MTAGSQRIALVTGAGSGIGRATALALVEAGFTVVLAGRRKELLDETASAAAPGAALAVPTDVSDPAGVEALFATVARRFGRLDVLFNNAGTNARVPFDELTDEQWSSVVSVNLTGTFYCARAAFRLMKAQSPQGGRIINNGSVSAHVPRPNSAPYVATKHALTGLTKSIALDGRRYNIACGQIDIGNAASERTYGRMSKGVLQADGSVKPEPTMDVENVARAVVMMATLPLDTNVPFLTIMATQMPYSGRG